MRLRCCSWPLGTRIFLRTRMRLFSVRGKELFLVVKKFSPWFQLYGEALLIHFIQSYVSPLCGESRKPRGFRDPSFLFRRVVKTEGFLHGFSSMEKHCSYISFSSICRFAAKSREGASFLGTPSFFSEGRLSQKVFSMVSALWRSIAHTFISFADCGGAPWVRNPGGLLFFLQDDRVLFAVVWYRFILKRKVEI